MPNAAFHSRITALALECAGICDTGELAERFCNYPDYVFEENRLGQKSWERAEQRLQQSALELALEKAGSDGVVLCFGSLYSIADIRAGLEEVI